MTCWIKLNGSSDLRGGPTTDKTVDSSPTAVSDRSKSVQSPSPQSKDASQYGKRTNPKFSIDDSEDGSVFGRWMRKIEKHAEFEVCSDRQKLLQFVREGRASV